MWNPKTERPISNYQIHWVVPCCTYVKGGKPTNSRGCTYVKDREIWMFSLYNVMNIGKRFGHIISIGLRWCCSWANSSNQYQPLQYRRMAMNRQSMVHTHTNATKTHFTVLEYRYSSICSLRMYNASALPCALLNWKPPQSWFPSLARGKNASLIFSGFRSLLNHELDPWTFTGIERKCEFAKPVPWFSVTLVV